MRAYIDRARTHGKFMEKQCAEFEVGRRHLARIMGKDPNEDFTQVSISSLHFRLNMILARMSFVIVLDEKSSGSPYLFRCVLASL